VVTRARGHDVVVYFLLLDLLKLFENEVELRYNINLQHNTVHDKVITIERSYAQCKLQTLNMNEVPSSIGLHRIGYVKALLLP